MAFDAHANFAYGTVATAPSPAASGTSLTLSAGAGAGFPAVPFNATVWPAGAPALAPNAEIVRVTARTGDVLTIARAAEPPSPARAIVVGDQFAATITAKTLQDVEGPVADARLSSNVALLNVRNVFTKFQTIDPGTPAENGQLLIRGRSGEGALIALTDLTALANQQTLYLRSRGNSLEVTAVDDVGAGYWSVQYYNGALTMRAPTGATPQILLSKDTVDSGPDYPRLLGLAGALELRRFDNTARILLLAAGLGDTPLDANQLLTGSIPDARLSPNVALKNVTNLFTQNQLVQKARADWQVQPAGQNYKGHFFILDPADGGGVFLTNNLAYAGTSWLLDDASRSGTNLVLTPTGLLVLTAPGGGNPVTPVQIFAVNATGNVTFPGSLNAQGGMNASQLITGTVADVRLSTNVALCNVDNAFSASQTVGGQLSVQGNLYEKNRLSPLGHWVDVPYSPANFGATGGAWTVDAAGVLRFSYTLVGKTAFIQVVIGSSVVSGAPTSINLALPFTMMAGQSGAVYYYCAPDYGWGFYYQPGQDQYIRLQRDPFLTPFAAASGVQVYASLAVQIL